MCPEEREVYVLTEGDGEWVRPTPASTAIVDAVVDRTDIDEADIDDIDTYVDFEELVSLLESEETGDLTFTVEGCEVTVDADGNVTVAD